MPITSLRRFPATILLVFLLIQSRAERFPGDFLDDNGRYLGSDGRLDQKLYIVLTMKRGLQDTVPYLGIGKRMAKKVKRFIIVHNGDSSQFLNNSWVYDDVVAIDPFESVRQRMIVVVSHDDRGEDTAACHNREFGALVTNQYKVVRIDSGKVALPPDTATVSLKTYGIEIEEFHSHPSGAYLGAGHKQPPSRGDIMAVGNRLGYVFAIRSKIVYIYNKHGVLATLPIDRFVKYK
jgi:hypothetical protein